VNEDDVLEMWSSVSCSKKEFKLLLEKKSFTAWTDMEDKFLFSDPDGPEYKQLVKLKGTEEMERRRKFLNVDNE
jgi:hypothetical protein